MDRQTVGIRSRFRLRVSKLRDGREWLPVSGTVVVTVSGTVESLYAGDEVVVVGLLSKPASARSRYDFDLRKHYRSQRVNALIFAQEPDSVSLLCRNQQSLHLNRHLDHVREHCLRILSEHLSTPSYKLVSAMLLGERHLISSEVRDQFLKAGAAHLLAISGLHVSILCFGFVILVKAGVLSRRVGLVATIVFVVFYCVLTGLRPPVLRASILVLLYCFAKLFGKNPISVNSLSLAALIVIVSNPASVYLPGTQLSFIAVATLVMLGERLQEKGVDRNALERFLLRKRTTWERRRDSMTRYFWLLLIASLAIWIATTPLVSASFHLISVVGVVANVALMIPMTLALYSSFLLLLFGTMGWAGGLAGVVEMFVQAVLQIIDGAAAMPYGHWWTAGVSEVWLVLFYVLFAIQFFFRRLRLRRRYQLIVVVIWLASCLWISEWNQQSRGKLIVTFVDVSHGTSVLVEFPNGAVALYDAGSLNSSKLALARVSAVLWERDVSQVDALILSHADLDHYNAVVGLCQRFQVRRVLVSPFMFQIDDSQALELLASSIDAMQLPLTKIDVQTRIEFDSDCHCRILHPSRHFRGQNDNANSLVWLIEYEGRRVLLTGDLEADGLAALAETTPLRCDLVMAPHHGSASANHRAIAEWTKAKQVVVSCGRDRLKPSVVQAYRSVGASVQVTASAGAVTCEIDFAGIRVVPFAGLNR